MTLNPDADLIVQALDAPAPAIPPDVWALVSSEADLAADVACYQQMVRLLIATVAKQTATINQQQAVIIEMREERRRFTAGVIGRVQ